MNKAKLFIAFVFVLFSVEQCLGQQEDTVVTLLDYRGHIANEITAQYIQVSYREHPGDTLWQSEIYTKGDVKLFAAGLALGNDGVLKTGLWEFYNRKGTLDSSGSFVLGKKNGEWRSYRADSTLENINHYETGKLKGIQLSYFSSGVLSDTVMLDQSQSGRMESFYETGNLLFEGNIVNGLKSGRWTAYYDDTAKVLQMTIIFNRDSAITVACFERNGNKQNTCIYQREASFKGGVSGFKKYLERTLTGFFELEKRGGTYTPVVTFYIDTNGKLSAGSVTSSGSKALDAYAENVILNSGDWNPAILFNKPVKAVRSQPITFVIPEE